MGSNGLALLDGLQRELASISTLKDAKRLADEAEAFRHYAKVSRKGLDTQNDCASVRFQAERKAGELLVKMPRAAGPGRGKKDEVASESFLAAVKEAGISYDAACRWQRYAALSPDAFRKKLEALCDLEGYELTTRDVVREIEAELGDPKIIRRSRRPQKQRAPIGREDHGAGRHQDACRVFLESLDQLGAVNKLAPADRQAMLRAYARIRAAMDTVQKALLMLEGMDRAIEIHKRMKEQRRAE